MTTKLTVDDKLTLIEKSGWPIAWDGCHKIYFLQDAAREAHARYYGFEIHPSSEVRRLWDIACPLRMVSRRGFDNDDFDHEWNISQFEAEDENDEDDYEDL